MYNPYLCLLLSSMINFLYIIFTINPVLFYPRYLGRAGSILYGRNDTWGHRPLLPTIFSANLYAFDAVKSCHFT